MSKIVITWRKKAGRWNGQPGLGPMCDAEKDWHERSFHASGEIYGCQEFPLNEPEINFSLFVFWATSRVFSKAFLTQNATRLCLL